MSIFLYNVRYTSSALLSAAVLRRLSPVPCFWPVCQLLINWLTWIFISLLAFVSSFRHDSVLKNREKTKGSITLIIKGGKYFAKDCVKLNVSSKKKIIVSRQIAVRLNTHKFFNGAYTECDKSCLRGKWNQVFNSWVFYWWLSVPS